MAHFRKIGGDLSGYDEARQHYILPVNKKGVIHLVAGEGLLVEPDDPDIVNVSAGLGDDKAAHKGRGLTDWEKEQAIRKIVISAKLKEGTTMLRAKKDGAEWSAPLKVQVTMDKDARRVGKTLGQVTPELRTELQELSLRDAVIRVAEDQMNSAIAQTSTGFGVYDIDSSYDWCGAFAHWCWKQASAIKGVPNPFGSEGHVLWSPQRAIHYAMNPTTPVVLLRYAGIDPMTGKGKQDYHNIGDNGWTLARGDVVLYRNGGAGSWKHVCLVDTVDGDIITTMDGNQGMPSIKRVKRSAADKNADGSVKLVFVHAFG